MPKKTITIDGSTHTNVTKFLGYLTEKSGKKYSLSGAIDSLLVGEPFVSQLKIILRSAIDTFEEFKKGTTNQTNFMMSVGKLITVNKWILAELEVRSSDAEPDLALHQSRHIVRHLVESEKLKEKSGK